MKITELSVETSGGTRALVAEEALLVRTEGNLPTYRIHLRALARQTETALWEILENAGDVRLSARLADGRTLEARTFVLQASPIGLESAVLAVNSPRFS